jgi:hypothetical protein
MPLQSHLLSMLENLEGRRDAEGSSLMKKIGKYGPTLSRHGVKMTCNYCKGDNHNAKGFPIKKLGVSPELNNLEV